MKILIVGGGGREHALATAFAKEQADVTLAPGNAGSATQFPCIAPYPTAIRLWCEKQQPDFVVIGPEKPLAEGLSDHLTALSIPCVGPSQAAARIETSKVFAKELMAEYGVPTAKWEHFLEPKHTLEYLSKKNEYPVVIKADALAGGKGVYIVNNLHEADDALYELKGLFGNTFSHVVEECLRGWEVSLFAVTDGTHFQTTPFVQDYKQLADGDKGPNTGGMGAVYPIPEAEPYRAEIEEKIIAPVLQAMLDKGCPYRGFLYCGLMITKEGPKVLEFNCRLGDPETQVLLPALSTPLSEVCKAILDATVDKLELNWSAKAGVCVVLASQGYPGKYGKGYPIRMQEGVKSQIYYSGIDCRKDELLTGGGRVMSLAAFGENVTQARGQVYRDAELIEFYGKYCRKDIALRKNEL